MQFVCKDIAYCRYRQETGTFLWLIFELRRQSIVMPEGAIRQRLHTSQQPKSTTHYATFTKDFTQHFWLQLTDHQSDKG